MKKGVTLIELLVFIGLMGTMTWGVTSISKRSERVQAVTQTAAQIKQAFQTAKAGMQNGRKDCTKCGAASGICGTAGDTPIYGWRVNIGSDANGTYYNMQGYCTPGNVLTAFFTTGNVYVSNLVTVTTTNSQITFLPGNKISNSITVTIAATGVTTRQVIINNKGEISNN